MAITRAQQVRQMYKKGSMKPVKQAGVMNYMPSEMVTVPKIAKSSPDTPTAKLAYITPEEQDILIDLNLYGSLDGKPNRGPGGIPSLEGDFGSPTGSTYSGGSAGEDGGSFTGGGGGGNQPPSPQLPPGVKSGSSGIVTKEDERRARKETQDFLKSKGLKPGGGNQFNFMDIINPTAKRKAMYNASLLIPGSKARITKYRKAYADYLKSMGITPTDELEDTDNLYDFFDKQAFEKGKTAYTGVGIDELNQKIYDKLAEDMGPFSNDPLRNQFETLTQEEFMAQNPDLFSKGTPTDVQSYGDFILENFGSPGVKFSGDVGNKEVYVKGYREDGSKIYDVRERRDGGGGDGGMSDYERRLLELENQLKNQQAAAPTTNPFAYRFLADGGRAEYRVGGASGREYDQGSPKSSSPNQGPAGGASAGGNYGGNRNPDQTYGGGSGNQSPQKINIPKPIKDVGNTAGELMFLKNVFELNPVGIMKNIGTKMFFDNLISDADTQQDQNMMLAFEPGSLKDKQLKQMYNIFEETGMQDPRMKGLMKEDIEQGGPLSLPKEAYQMVADGGRIGAMGGGIMNADMIGGMMDGNMDDMGRQMYGLGKLVKKVTRGVKKIVKSPIGKAALIGAGFGLAGMGPFKALGSTKFGLGTKNFFLNKILGNPVGDFGTTRTGGLLKFLQTPKGAMSAIGIASALPLLFQGQEEEEDYDPYRGPDIDIDAIRRDPYGAMGGAYRFAADGGIMRPGYQEGGDAEPVAKKTMPLIDMDGKEKDYRETGGFVDMGRMERADDVPARLSKNEFVFTADAVRNAGEGDIDKGAEVMYNMMKNLEAGGEVSEESQGLEGARKMFQTSQRLEEVL